jgi:deoxyxylulose-5-phosphate synthase
MAENILSQIQNPADLRRLTESQLPQLAQELRDYIINIVATKEGHLGASLGVVELTIALHFVFNTPDDLLVWDVGHQAYGHKIRNSEAFPAFQNEARVFTTLSEWGIHQPPYQQRSEWH